MREKVLKILQETRPDVDFIMEKKLITDEIIDSFDIVSIIAAFDEELTLDMDVSMVNEENFNSLELMVQFLEKATAGDEAQVKLWGENRKKFMLAYPSEQVIRFLKKNFPDGNGRKVLDFGCGSGRNEVVMMDMGFDIIAVDYNPDCLDMVRYLAKEKNYNAIQFLSNSKLDIPVPDHSIDALVGWGSFFCFTQQERDLFFKEMYRVLKPGGVVLADWRTVEDAMYQKGKEIEENFYCLENCGSLTGFNYWFCDENQIKELYTQHGFEITNIEKHNIYVNNQTELNSHYVTWAIKS